MTKPNNLSVPIHLNIKRIFPLTTAIPREPPKKKDKEN
jgi:hypothetical protein